MPTRARKSNSSTSKTSPPEHPARQPTGSSQKTKGATASRRPSSRSPGPRQGTAAAPPAGAGAEDVARQIEDRFREIGGWRGETLTHLRALIRDADPALVEERKWIKPSNPFGVPTYSRGGLVLTLEVYKAYVKVTFAYGSQVKDPKGIFNASLLGLRRAVDVREGETVDAAAFQALVREAVAVNLERSRAKEARPAARPAARRV